MENDHIADDRKKVRLVDANALIENSDVFTMHTKEYGSIEVIPVDAIGDAPTVDAVEVVRCEKCKHYQQYHKGRTEELCEWGKCKLISMDVDMPCNGFCCFGERRTNEPV